MNWHGKPKYSVKTCPSATLSTTNPTWPDLGSNPGCHGGKQATNSLSYGMVYGNFIQILFFINTKCKTINPAKILLRNGYSL
jgi:hypothetical protein